MAIMASGIARGRVRTTTTESRNMAAILQSIGLQRHVSSDSSGRMPSFLGGIFKEKKISSTNDNGGWSINLFKKQEFKTTAQSKNSQAKKLRRRKKESRKRPTSTGKEAKHSGSRAKGRIWDNTEQYPEAKLTRASYGVAKGGEIPDEEDNRTLQVKFRASKFCCVAVQKGHMIEQVMNKRNQRVCRE